MKRHHRSKLQMSLPGVKAKGPDGRINLAPKSRIMHKRILVALQEASGGGRNIAEIYRHEVLPIKSRTIQLLGHKSPAQIINTLLGFEVQASYKRVPCPDLVTARYLKLFTELGCRSIKLPYDPTITDRIIPELELAMNRLAAGVRALFPGDRSLQVYVLRRFCLHIRDQLHSQ